MPVLKKRELRYTEKLAKLLGQRLMFYPHVGEPVTFENIAYLFDILFERRQRRTCHQYFLFHFLPLPLRPAAVPVPFVFCQARNALTALYTPSPSRP